MPGGVSDKGLLVVTNDGYDITGDLLKRVYPSNDPGGPAIGFEMNPDGAKRFARMTGEHVGEQIAIIVNGEIYSAPVVRMQISSTGVINGLEDQKEADMLVKALSSGSLKAPLIVEQESFVGAAIPKGRWWW
jgi:preprotein translocase subunit SecD